MSTTAKFGPSGHSLSYLENKKATTLNMPSWLVEFGLDIFEYSFGKGVRISQNTAEEIGQAILNNNLEISVHAPYYINFASPEPEKAENSINYLTQSLQALRYFGGKRCVFHPGALGKQDRKDAFLKAEYMLNVALERIEKMGFDDLIICPETAGKQGQVGTVEEIIVLANLGKNVYPCLDFGHINSLYGGSLKKVDDYQRIFDMLFDGVGEEKTKNMHVHFSKIKYGEKGELKHLTFEDDIYGPEFEPFIECVVKNNLTPRVLSESNGTQAEDALSMKKYYNSIFK